jgi:hypothetical protein
VCVCVFDTGAHKHMIRVSMVNKCLDDACLHVCMRVHAYIIHTYIDGQTTLF